MKIKLKGTREKIDFDLGSYRIIERLAIKENKSVEDIVFEAYEDTFIYQRIKLREAIEDLMNAIKDEFVPIINKARKEIIRFVRHINWLQLRGKIIIWFKKVFNCKQNNT